MRRHPAVLALLVAAASTLATSCSDDAEDSLDDACDVVVDSCGLGASHGACIDSLGRLPPECVQCIAGHRCDYATCQRISGCRIPFEWLPPDDG